jgi:hypothetical protein
MGIAEYWNQEILDLGNIGLKEYRLKEYGVQGI